MSRKPLRLTFIAGARPNFMKVAPLIHASSACPDVDATLVHTGQHYDEHMSAQFFRDLRSAPTGCPSRGGLCQSRRADRPCHDRFRQSARRPPHGYRRRCRRCEFHDRMRPGGNEARGQGRACRSRAAQPRSRDARRNQPRPHRSNLRLPLHDRARRRRKPPRGRHRGRQDLFRRQRDDRHAAEASRPGAGARDRPHQPRRCRHANMPCARFIARATSTAPSRPHARSTPSRSSRKG